MKSMFTSKTFWVNILALLAMVLQAVTGKEIINLEIPQILLKFLKMVSYKSSKSSVFVHRKCNRVYLRYLKQFFLVLRMGPIFYRDLYRFIHFLLLCSSFILVKLILFFLNCLILNNCLVNSFLCNFLRNN